MAIDYKSYDFQIYEYLFRLQQILENGVWSPKTEEWLSQIRYEQDRIKTRRFRVAVVGEFKRGKSSFVNALLGQVVLPVDASPTTATINRITYGSVPKAYLRYKDGLEQKVEIGELAAYVTKLTGEAAENAALIEEAVVEYPSIFCQNYVDLIDTPGMNDDDSMNQVTVSKLEQIDLAIVAISANLPFSDTENNFVVQLLENPEICQIIVVITYIDMVRERDRERILTYLHERICRKVLERLQALYPEEDPIFQKYERIFGNLQQFAVSSVDGLLARETGDMELLESSGFMQLNQRLPRLILSSQNHNAMDKAMDTIDRIIQEYQASLPEEAEVYLARAGHLEEEKKRFARIGYESIETLLDEARVRIYERINQFEVQMTEIVLKGFSYCLSSMRTLDINVLEGALIRQSVETYRYACQEIQARLLPDIRRLYQEEAWRSITDLCSRLRAVISPYGEVFQKVEKMFSEFSSCCWLPAMIMKHSEFGWIRPLTPEKEFFPVVDIIDWVNASAKESLWYYCSLQKEEISRQLQTACMKAAEHLERIVVEMYHLAEEQTKQWRQEARTITNRITEEKISLLKRENTQLQKQLRQELNQEVL
ncbi:dynamin family protein [Lachnospiraceae bacterium 62-35]